ncbi:MAG: hypothetical protein JWL59_5036 [Chthoniobacteraceae bacterium]|nr:hypothetical protein [Chthoniobacteraceae bacterium]
MVLRHGNESAALFSPTTRIAKVNELEGKKAPIGIDAQLIELPDAIAKTMTIPGHGLLSPAPLQASIVSAPLSRVLTKEHVRELLDGLALHSDVHVLKMPRVMVKSYQGEFIELVHSSALPVFSPTPAELENHSTYQSGVLLEVEAAVRGDGMLLIPQIAEFKITPGLETPAG